MLVTQPKETNKREGVTTFSYGCSITIREGDTPEEILQERDTCESHVDFVLGHKFWSYVNFLHCCDQKRGEEGKTVSVSVTSEWDFLAEGVDDDTFPRNEVFRKFIHVWRES